jgi:VIT1/CCC1 family predicted Fe2+/Mn2+ transporter
MDRTDKPLSELLRDLIDQISRVLRHEIGLAKAEMSEKVSQAGSAVGMLAVSLMLAIGAVVILLTSAVFALSSVMEPWLAALLVGGIAAAIAAALAAKGLANLKARNLAPTRTIDSLREDLEFVKERAR